MLSSGDDFLPASCGLSGALGLRKPTASALDRASTTKMTSVTPKATDAITNIFRHAVGSSGSTLVLCTTDADRRCIHSGT